jgi:hypothetical protein
MPEILQLGPIMIKLSWVLFAISGIAGLWMIKFKLKTMQYMDLKFIDLLVNGLLIVIFTWKFSPVLFSPSLLWTQPFSLLVMTGSSNGMWIGVILAIIYMEMKLHRSKTSRWILLDLIPYGISVMILVYSLLSWQYGSQTALPWGISIENPDFKYHPINIYMILITIPMLVWLLKRDKSLLGNGKIFFEFLTFYGIGLMIVSLFKPQTSLLFGISDEQFFYILMMVVGSVMPIFWKKLA